MLQAIRSRTGSWAIKILFAVLVLSFAVWGIGDFVRDEGTDRVVIEVGDVTIDLATVDRSLRNEMNRLRPLLGGDLDSALALELGLVGSTVDQLVARALYDLEGRRLGLAPPDLLIAEQIRRLPEFADPVTGQFDPNRYRSLLAASGLSEEMFVGALRGDLVREQLARALVAGADAPDALLAALNMHREETRVAETVRIAHSEVEEPAVPEEPALVAFHEEHPDRFTAPEYRDLTVVTLTPRDVVDEIRINEEVLREEFEARRALYSAPERRAFDQVIVTDATEAEDLARGARDLGSLRAAAEETDTLSVVPIESSVREDMLPVLAEAGFALAQGEVSEPVESPFGWHVLQATEIQPGREARFEEARDELREAIALERAQDVLFELGNELDDALAGGASLPEAAGSLGLEVITLAGIARDGSARQGDIRPDLPDQAAILEAAFALDQGEESLLEETASGNYFAVRVNRLEPPAVRPFETVREEVVAAWRDEERAAQARRLAAAAAERLARGEPAGSVAADLGGTAGRTDPIRRDGRGGALPNALVNEVFGLSEGEVTTGSLPGTEIALRLAEIRTAEPVGQDSELPDQLAQALGSDLLEQFTAGLRSRYTVEVDDEAINRFVVGAAG